MNDKTKVATAVVATALMVGGGGALAAGGSGSTAPTTTAAMGTTAPAGPLAAAAAYLGLTVDALRTQLAAGGSLAGVATAQSKPVSGLESALLADLTTHLDADVAAGRSTSAQETTALAQAKVGISAMVDRAGLPARQDDRSGLEHAAATYLGLSDADLQTKLAAGQSLATVAAAQGRSIDGLKDALVTQFRSTLDGVIEATHTGGPAGPGGPPPGLRG
ncbi:MAG TPA: hypothetical protein VIJ70_09770 [Gaiellaceae bacterium]